MYSLTGILSVNASLKDSIHFSVCDAV